MEKPIVMDEQLLQKAAQVLGRFGMDVNTVINITLSRIVNDGDIRFLFAGVQQEKQETDTTAEKNVGQDRMSKSSAVALFRKMGYKLRTNVTFASKNKTLDYYWANPSLKVLENDWYLILNDWRRRKLHLFLIPEGTLQVSSVVCRSDIENKMDILIEYNDSEFTDTRSMVSFAKFWVKSIAY